MSAASVATQFTRERGLQYGFKRWEGSTPEQRSEWGRRIRLLPRYRKPKPRKRRLVDFYELAITCTPTASEVKAMLEDLIATIGQPKVSAITGISRSHLIQILHQGQAKAGASSRKYVWVLWCAILHPSERLNGLNLVTCGRFTMASGPHHAGKVASEARRRDKVADGAENPS